MMQVGLVRFQSCGDLQLNPGRQIQLSGVSGPPKEWHGLSSFEDWVKYRYEWERYRERFRR